MDRALVSRLRAAVIDAGGPSKVARELGVEPPTISQWISLDTRRNRPVPTERMARLERLLRFQVTRQDLRPNDWHEIWPELVRAEPTTTQEAA
ncbi:transcriptional regulator [Cupriavidus basilensis]|uniref:transcriptional regulator n=1 Tax=Cupriavidus basilensis TaxID=68895 RepID=UPI003D350C41